MNVLEKICVLGFPMSSYRLFMPSLYSLESSAQTEIHIWGDLFTSALCLILTKISVCSGVFRRRGSACARQPRAHSDSEIRRKGVFMFTPDTKRFSLRNWGGLRYFIQRKLCYLNPSCDPLLGLGAFILFIINWVNRMKGRVWRLSYKSLLVSPAQHWREWGPGELPPALLLWPHWLHWVLEKNTGGWFVSVLCCYLLTIWLTHLSLFLLLGDED